MWIWQRPDWPKFQFDADRLAAASSLFVSADAELVARVEVGEADCRADLAVELMLSEAIASYAIEGESLDRDSVRSSLLNVMGRLSESPPQDGGGCGGRRGLPDRGCPPQLGRAPEPAATWRLAGHGARRAADEFASTRQVSARAGDDEHRQRQSLWAQRHPGPLRGPAFGQGAC